MWLIDKTFEFTTHHDLEDCKVLLSEISRPATFLRLPVKVTVTHDWDWDLVTFKMTRGGYAECRGMLHRGPDDTARVSGSGRMSRYLVFTMTTVPMAAVSISKGNDDVWLSTDLEFLLFFVAILYGLWVWAAYDRDRAVSMVINGLTDQGKAKKKSDVVD